jgi:hypothetical protein
MTGPEGHPAGGNPPALVSPWIWHTEDFRGQKISLSIAFDNITHLILGITTYRDPDCLFTKILIGLGPDGTPDTTDKVVTVPAGTTNVVAALISALATVGVSTIDNVLSWQMTAA